MSHSAFNFNKVDPSWYECINKGLDQIDPSYLSKVKISQSWLPGFEKIFNAFSLPLNQVNFVLFGESPYPRPESANGYAFWDEAVSELWSREGLSKKVNRATSLRNIMKMLLVAEGLLNLKNTSQEAIATISKNSLVHTNCELFKNFLQHGFLLLNATPILSKLSKNIEAKMWIPFVHEVLQCLILNRPHVKFILFGKIAQKIMPMIENFPNLKTLYAEHPYNHSFIENEKVLKFFKPLHLLKKSDP